MTTANSPLYVADELPQDEVAATRRFEDRYLMSIGAVPPPRWADIGELIPTEAPLLTFPISAFAQQYERFTGEPTFKTLDHKSFDVKPEPFQAGHQAKLLEIYKSSWANRQWLEGTARFMKAEAMLRCKQIAAILAVGESTLWGTGAGIDGANFFSAVHRSDITDLTSATWSNYQVTTKDPTDITDLTGEVAAFQSGLLDENGDTIDADPTAIMVPAARFEKVRHFLDQEYIVDAASPNAGQSNPFYKRFKVIKNAQLDKYSALDFYLIDENLIKDSGLPPWLSIRMTVPSDLGLAFDTPANSTKARHAGIVRASSKIWYGFAAGFPYGIRKVKGK